MRYALRNDFRKERMTKKPTRKAAPSGTNTQSPRPRVKRIDPDSARFQQWVAEARDASPTRRVARTTLHTQPQTKAIAAEPHALDKSISYVHAYANLRPRIDTNACGQAAIATMLDFYHKDPFQLPRTATDPTDHQSHWEDGAAIDAIKAADYGPNALGGLFGTTPGRIKDALTHFGLATELAYADEAGSRRAWMDLNAYVSQGKPVPVLIDTTRIGGPPSGLHWAIVYRINGDNVFLGNWRREPFSVDVFLAAWRCSQMPPFVRNYHYCAAYVAG